jgi:hypothetical protein
MPPITVPLKRFIAFLEDTEKLDLEYPYLCHREWLLSHWAFSDDSAIYGLEPQPWPTLIIPPAAGPFTRLWRCATTLTRFS